MALSKIKALHKSTASRKFTDREEARASFTKLKKSYTEGILDMKVLMYYGVGGIGKSSLLAYLENELRNENITDRPVNIISLNLESANLDTPARVLFAIHQQLKSHCYLFEYALARYWSLQGWTIENIRRRKIKSDSLLFDLVEAGTGAAGVFAPTRLLKTLIDKGGDIYRNRLEKYRDDISEINTLPETELEKRLPYYLGTGIEEAAISGNELFFFFLDTFETLSVQKSFGNTKHDGEEWLRELIGSAMNGLYIFAGREYLRWEDAESEWADYIEQHIIGSLSDKDANHFLINVPVSELEVRDAIISTAGGVPLYLDLCVSNYIMAKQQGKPLDASMFRMAREDVLKRFLSHLEPEQAEALKVCSLAGSFDMDLFSFLVKEFHINIPLTLFKQFCKTSYIYKLSDVQGIYRVHNIVRDYIMKGIGDDVVRKIYKLLISRCLEILDKGDYGRAAWVFSNILSLYQIRGGEVSEEEDQMAGQISYRLIESGNWKILGRDIQGIRDKMDDLNPTLAFAEALCYRKTGHLDNADRIYRKLQSATSLNKSLKPLLDFHAAHAIHLKGGYLEAQKIYRFISGQKTVNSQAGLKAKELATRQLADIMMLMGNFKEALAVFDSLAPVEDDPTWDAEVCRFRGHVYRFNFMLDKAEELYRQALDISEARSSESMVAKCLTNLAETLCWIKPAEALEWGRRAIEMNEVLDAPIETGKAMAAITIAMAISGEEMKETLRVNREAEKIQVQTAYKSGVLFARLACVIAYISAGDTAQAKTLLGDMEKISNEIGGVYTYLKCLPEYLLGICSYPESGFDWLDREASEKTWRRIAESIRETP